MVFTETFNRSRAEWPPAKRFTMFACITLFAGTAVINGYGAIYEESQSGPIFHLLMAAFSLYLLGECARHLRRTDVFGLLAPPFLASIVHFFLSYVLPAAGTLFDPWILDRFAKYFWSQPEQLSDAVLLIGTAAFFMWRGYDFGQYIAQNLRRRLQRWPQLRTAIQPSMLPILSLQVSYFALVSYAISLGVFGMTSSEEMRERYVNVLEALNLGAAGGSLSLFLLLTFLFRRHAQGRADLVLWVICGGLVLVHLVIGTISGFKSQIVMPFVMLAFAKFVATREISYVFIGTACIALFFAYQVIEPYRAYLGHNQAQGASDISKTLDGFQKSQEQKDPTQESDLTLGTQVVSRFDLLGMTSVGIALATGNPLIETKREEFAESIYLAIPYAFTPRVLWPNKPIYASGVWFSNVVLGNTEDTTTSVGMGPVTWLYIVGGSLGVALGFVGIGMLQAVMFDGFARAGAGGFIIYLSSMMALVMIPSDVGPVLISILRILPIAFLAQLFLLQAASPGNTARD